MSQANETRLGGTALPRPEGLPDGLEPLWGIVRKACEFEAADRYQTPLEMKNALEAIECLPDLDEAPELSGSRSGRKQGTGRGTASSSANSLNGTFRRTPYSRGVEDESIAAARDEKKGDPAAKTEETPPDTGSRHGARKKWIAAAAALLLVAGGILAAVLLKPGRGTENSWNVLAGEATATSVTLTWTGEPEGQGILCRCFSNGIQIRPDLEAVSPLTITGLAPGTEYVFRLTAGEESAEVSADTKGEAVSGNIPIFERADFYSIRVKDLEETPAEEAADELFKEVPNGVLQMRTGPVSAQIEIQTLWLLFSTVSEDYSGELVLSLTTPEGAVFSRSVKLELPVSSGYVSKRVSLEELFGDVYAGCGGWPGEKCSLRLYLDGMSVCEKTISFTSGN